MKNFYEFLKNKKESDFDPDNANDVSQMRELLSGIDKENADKIMQILSDKEKTQKLMESEAARKLMKILGGSKNG